MAKVKAFHNLFYTYINYWGELASDDTSKVFGFENISEEYQNKSAAVIPNEGGCFGYVHSGTVFINLGKNVIQVNAGWWFSTENGANIFMSSGARVAVWQRLWYRGVNSLGQMESEGRLGYIDGCMNSVLSGPHKKGLPVLNALYMPGAIHQTMHTHPSLRSGIIVNGDATCDTPKRVEGLTKPDKDIECTSYPLQAGAIFVLSRNGWHKFRTDLTDGTLSLVAYHPDSNFGPDNEDAPMINRTMVGGKGNQHSIKSEKKLLTKIV